MTALMRHLNWNWRRHFGFRGRQHRIAFTRHFRFGFARSATSYALSTSPEVLRCTRYPRLRLAKTDRWLWVVLSRARKGWRTGLVLVKPETRHRVAPTKLPAFVDLEERAPHGAT